MVEFSFKSNLKLRLVYYPPYHSKYNPIERCWACLENFGNGAIWDSLETVIQWSKNLTWKGVKPRVKLVEKTYLTGVKPSEEELKLSKECWHPSRELAAWDITIIPTR